MEEEKYNNIIVEEENESEIMQEENYNYMMCGLEDEIAEEITGKEIEDIKNIHEKKMKIRKLFHKTAIKKYDYKLEYDYESPQDERRQILLKHQKKCREDTVNATRGILENFFPECKGSMKTTRKKRIMLSEWMLDVPEKFIEEWIMILCPVGIRTILVASKGKTKAYTRKGYHLSTFSSALPGGNHKCRRSQYTIIDCIWVESQKTYYVLDVLAWANHPTMLCEAECRRFLVNSHLSEIEELKEINHEINKYTILPIPHVSCNTDLSEVLIQFRNQYPLDGLLFYHRNGYYRFGPSPLVVWLKPFMLSEVLGIFVPPPYDEKPEGYIDYKHYICQYTHNIYKKNFFKNYFGIAMECA